MEKSVKLREIDKMIEEFSNNNKELWERIKDKKLSELSFDELIDYLQATMVYMKKFHLIKDNAEEK